MQKNFLCSTCQEEFTSKELLNDHNDKNHKSNDKFECPVCKTMLDEEKSFATHFLEVHRVNNVPAVQPPGNTGEKLKCEFCNIECTTVSDLEVHKVAEHTYSCDTCGYSGTSVSGIEKHILETHVHSNTAGKFSCDECD